MFNSTLFEPSAQQQFESSFYEQLSAKMHLITQEDKERLLSSLSNDPVGNIMLVSEKIFNTFINALTKLIDHIYLQQTQQKAEMMINFICENHLISKFIKEKLPIDEAIKSILMSKIDYYIAQEKASEKPHHLQNFYHRYSEEEIESIEDDNKQLRYCQSNIDNFE